MLRRLLNQGICKLQSVACIEDSWYGHLRLENLLKNKSRCIGIEVGDFNGSGLLEESSALGICWDERRALIGIFGGDIARDGTALVKNETIVLDIERQD